MDAPTVACCSVSWPLHLMQRSQQLAIYLFSYIVFTRSCTVIQTVDFHVLCISKHPHANSTTCEWTTAPLLFIVLIDMVEMVLHTSMFMCRICRATGPGVCHVLVGLCQIWSIRHANDSHLPNDYGVIVDLAYVSECKGAM